MVPGPEVSGAVAGLAARRDWALAPVGYRWRLGLDGWEPDGWDLEAELVSEALGGTTSGLALAAAVMTGPGPWDSGDRPPVARQWACWAERPGSILPDWPGPIDGAPALRNAIWRDEALLLRAVRSVRCPGEMIGRALRHPNPQITRAAFRNDSLALAVRVEASASADESWRVLAASSPLASVEFLLGRIGEDPSPAVRLAAMANSALPWEALWEAAMTLPSGCWAALGRRRRYHLVMEAVLRSPRTPEEMRQAVLDGLARRWPAHVAVPPATWAVVALFFRSGTARRDGFLKRRRHSVVVAAARAAGTADEAEAAAKARAQERSLARPGEPGGSWEAYDANHHAMAVEYESRLYLWALDRALEAGDLGGAAVCSDALHELRQEMCSGAIRPHAHLGPARFTLLRWMASEETDVFSLA